MILRRLLALIATFVFCIIPVMANELGGDSVAISSDSLALTSEGSSDDAVIREVPRPATPAPPAPPPTPRPTPNAGPLLSGGQVGTLSFSVDFDGSSRLYHTAVTATGAQIHGSLSATGTDAFGSPLGVVTVGDLNHHTSVGSLNDPLSGVIVRNGEFTGADMHRGNGPSGFDAFAGHRLDGSTLAGIERSSGNTTDALGFLSNGGSFGGAILRHDVVTSTSWGSLDSELLLGSHGVGAGIEARTRGRTFIDATLSRAIGTLPLQQGDLPTSLSIGRTLSSATTLSAGYAESQGSPAQAFVGVATKVRNISFAINASPNAQSLFLGTNSNAGYTQLFASTGSQSVFGVRGSYAINRLQFEFDGTHSPGVTSGTAQFRTAHSGLNLAAGVDMAGGLLRPLLGVVASVTPLFALEAAVMPGSSGKPALRLSVVAGFRNRPKPVATFPLSIAVNAPAGSAPLRLFVDGAPASALKNGTGSVALTAGTHDIYVVTSDGAYGSAQRDVVAGIDRTITLPLIAQRSIHGRVRFDAPAGRVPVNASLQGVRVVLAPGGESAICDADGVFVFPRAPYDPSSTVLVDPETVPRDFAIPQPIAIDAAADLDLPLSPARHVERQVFR